MSTSSPHPLLETPYAQHVCDFEYRIATEVAFDAEQQLAYALGQGFLDLAQLNNPDFIARLGIQRIWFARYFKRHVQLPTLTPNESREIPQSQVRLGITLIENETWTPEREALLMTHLYQHLPIRPEEVDTFTIETDKTCCHSPCFGCMDFDVHTAIQTQGRTPWLAILEAKKNVAQDVLA